MDIAWVAVGFSSYIALKMFQSYCDLEAEDTKYLKLKWQNPRSNPGPLALALQVSTDHGTAALESMFGFYLGRHVSLKISKVRFLIV